jgi:hypothetical protein
MKGEHTNLMPVYTPTNHSEYRAKERIHIKLTQEINEEITLRIRNNLYKYCKKSKSVKNVYKYKVYVNGRLRELLNDYDSDVIGVVIDKISWQILTIYKTY